MRDRTGFEQNDNDHDEWRTNLRASWINYLVTTLGRSVELARERAEEEISGASAAEFCTSLIGGGVRIDGMNILEVGSGHGTLSIELARRGANVVGIEPCEPWRNIGNLRATDSELGKSIEFIDGDAQELPFPDKCFDIVISRQVLEHVKLPRIAIGEMARVVKQDGLIYISCENYLAFWEQHYDVFWVPLAPKSIASIYLRLIGKNPEFLQKHITYTLYPVLVWWCLENNLWSESWGTRRSSTGRLVSWLCILIKSRAKLFKVGFSSILIRHSS